MSHDYHLNRPRGNLLPRQTAAEEPKPCMKFNMNIEHYKRTGEIIPLTEPEEFIPPEDANTLIYNDWTSNPTNNEEGKEMPKGFIADKPTKEQLTEDVKTMTNRQIATKYGLSVPTIGRCITEYGVQRRNLLRSDNGPCSTEETVQTEAVPREPEVTKAEAKPDNPSMEEYEKFFTDAAEDSKPIEPDTETIPMTVEEVEEAIWKNIEADIKLLRQRRHERAEKEFQDRLLKLLECC